jgi:hypothetical protein
LTSFLKGVGFSPVQYILAHIVCVGVFQKSKQISCKKEGTKVMVRAIVGKNGLTVESGEKKETQKLVTKAIKSGQTTKLGMFLFFKKPSGEPFVFTATGNIEQVRQQAFSEIARGAVPA